MIHPLLFVFLCLVLNQSINQSINGQMPIITGISHPKCLDSGDANDSDIYGCPIIGGDKVTLIGRWLSIDVVNVTNVCADQPIYQSNTSMTCTLIGGLARSVTNPPIAILSNGSYVNYAAPRVHYAYMPSVNSVYWYGPNCINQRSINNQEWPKVYTRCPWDGTVGVTITGTNFQNIGPIPFLTFYANGQSINLCNGPMTLSLTQSISGGVQTQLTCQFIRDPSINTTVTDGILMTNGGNFSIFTSLTFYPPPIITLIDVPTSTQLSPLSIVDAPVYWTIPSPGSSQLGVFGENFVDWGSNPHITIPGCQYNPGFYNGNTLNCSLTQGAGSFIDLVVVNSPGFGRSMSNVANVTKSFMPTVTAVRSDWCFQDASNPMRIYNCPIYDPTWKITIIGTNFDRFFNVHPDHCVWGSTVRVNSTYAYCNGTATDQNGANSERAIHISTNGVTQWWNTGAVFHYAPRPTFSTLSMSSCFGSTTKFLTGCPTYGSYISLNNTQILSFYGTNFFKGPASIQIGSASQTGAQPCIPGTMVVISPTRLDCQFNLQSPLDTMTQTSLLVAGGWTDISTGGGGSITFAGAPTVSHVDIPLCTFNSLVNNYTNCPFDGNSPNITVTGTLFNAGPDFTTILLTSTYRLVCNPVVGSTITAIIGVNAYTTLTCQLISDSSVDGGTVLPSGNIYTNGGNASLWSSLTYAMWPIVNSLASDVCDSLSPLSLADCPVVGNVMAPALLNITTDHLQPDSVVTMDNYACQSFDRSLDVNFVVCKLNYSSTSVRGLTATTVPVKINNPIGYGYTRTLANVTFASVPTISALTLVDCNQTTPLVLFNCPAGQNMSTLFINGTFFTDSFNVSSNVCVPGSVVVSSTTTASCTVQANASSVLSVLSVTSQGVAGYLPTAATLQYAPLPVISSVSNSLCIVSSTPRVLSNCPLVGSTITITGSNIAVGPHPAPQITLTPNPDNITPCVNGTTTFDPLGTWISCQIVDLTQSVSVQLRGLLDNITVTTTGGVSSLSAALAYQPVPVISALSSVVCANSGPMALFGCPVYVNGTAILTIRGGNFLAGSTINDTTICTTGAALNVVSATMITCPLANFSSLAETKSIVIINPPLYGSGASTFIATVQSTNLLPPTVTALYNRDCGQAVDGISLIGCPTLGGNTSTLTITGTNFDFYLPTLVKDICDGPVRVVNSSYGLCPLASNLGSSSWLSTITTNGGSTTNSLVSLQYAVAPTLNNLLVSACVGNGTDVLSECPTTGGQIMWLLGQNFIGSKFDVVNDQQIAVCNPASIVVYNFTTASCVLTGDAAFIGTTVTGLAVQTFGGVSVHTFTLGYQYPPVVYSVDMNGCTVSGSPASFAACPFDPQYGLSMVVQGANFTQGLIPQTTIMFSRATQICDASSLTINRTTITCLINRALVGLPGSSVAIVEVGTQAGFSTVFTQLSFSNRVSITSMQSSLCVVTGNDLTGCPVIGHADSPFTVTLNVVNLMTSTPVIAGGVCSSVSYPSVGRVLCVVNETMALAGAALPIVLVDQFGYMDSSASASRAIVVAQTPSITTFSGMDASCKQNGVVGLKDCPISGGNVVVFNGNNFDQWFQASICNPTTIAVVSSTQVMCEILTKTASYHENIQISTHGTAGWINTTTQISYAAIPIIHGISSPRCNRSGIFDINDCPLQGGALLNITGQFLNGGALSIVTTVGSNAVCISNTVVVSPNGTWITCTMSDFTAQLPSLYWPFTLTTNGGLAAETMSVEWWPLPRLLGIASSVCRSYDNTTLIDCPLEAGVAMTVIGQNFRPDVTVTDPTDCLTVTYLNSTHFVCTLAYRPRSAVDLVVVTNPNGFGASLEIASITSSSLAFPVITAFNNSECTPSPSSRGSMINCSSQPDQTLTIIGNNFDLYNPVYVHDVCGAPGPVAINVVTSELAYCTATVHDAFFSGGVFAAHIENNGGEAIFPRVTITWFTLVAPVEVPASRSSTSSPRLANLPSNMVQVNEQGNFTLQAPPPKGYGYPVPGVFWQVSYDNVTWTTIDGANTTSLSVGGVDPSMVGIAYRPVYTNSLGSVAGEPIALFVEVSPRPVQPPASNTTVPYGSAAVLNATVMGNPVPAVEWQYLSESGAWVSVPETTSTPSNVSVVVSSLSVSGQTSYMRTYRTCFSNAFGSNCTDAILVYAEQYPRDIAAPQRNTSVPYGQPLTLTSQVYAWPAPTVVQWYRSNDTMTWTPFNNGSRVTNSSSDPATVQAYLDLPENEEPGVSYYRVCYTNSIGTNCSEVMIVTQEEPPVPEYSSASSFSKSGIAGVVVGCVLGGLLLCLLLLCLLLAAMRKRGPQGQDAGIVPASGAAKPSAAASASLWIGALCGLAEPKAKQAGIEHDIAFQA